MRILKYLLIILIISIIALPFVLKYGAIYAIKAQGAKNVNIESVFLNLFTGTLEINGIHIYGENNQGLHSDKLIVDIGLQRLFNKQAFIEEVLLQNFNLDIEQQSDKIIIAGLTLPTTEETVDSEQAQSERSNSSPWGFGVGKLIFQNVNFNVKSLILDSKFAINNLEIKSIYSWLPANSSEIYLDIAVNDNPIHLETSVKLFQETLPTSARLRVTNLQLDPFIHKQQGMPFDKLSVILDTELNTTFEKHGDNIKVTSSGIVALNNLNYISSDHEIQLDKLQWKGDVALTNLLPVDLSLNGVFTLDKFALLDKARGLKALNNNITVDAGYLITLNDNNPNIRTFKPTQVSITGTQAFSDKEKLDLVSIEKIGVKNLALESLEKIGLENFQIQNISLLKNKAIENSSPILTLDNLEVTSVSYSPSLVNIDKLNLASLKGRVVLNEKAELLEQRQLDKIFPTDKNNEEEKIDQTKQTQNAHSETVEPGASIHLVINQFNLNGKSKFNFTDNSVTPIFNTELHEIQIAAKNIATGKPNEKLEFSLDTNIDEYGQFNISGNAKPFSEKLDANFKGDIKSVELIPFSSYSGKAAGIHIKRGILHADLKGDIKQDIMKIENTFIFDQLTVESDDSEASKDFLSSLPMPLDLLLDVLRDKQNRIELKIPVDGNVQDPQFSLQDVYNTAMKKALKYAATRYLTQMVQPLGLIMTASDLAQKAMAPRFESLIYTSGVSDLSDENTKHLDNIAKLLSEREMLRLTLCGTAVQDDWPEIQKTLKEIPADDKDFKKKTLLKLAGERTKKAKRYLVETKSIDAKRLLSCNPKILKDEEKEKAKSQLEISL